MTFSAVPADKLAKLTQKRGGYNCTRRHRRPPWNRGFPREGEAQDRHRHRDQPSERAEATGNG